MTSYDIVIKSRMANSGRLGSAILDFWISPKLQENAEIKQKVTETNKVTLVWAKTTVEK